MTIGQAIRKARIERKFSQHFLAHKSGLAQAAISFWENDKREPSVAHLILLADALCISLDELVGRERR